MKPPSPETIRKYFPGVVEGHQALQAAASKGGPLDERMRELILLGAFTVGRQEGGFKSHCRRALRPERRPRKSARRWSSP